MDLIKIQSKRYGELLVWVEPIDRLFSNYSREYTAAFSLTQKSFHHIRQSKLDRGGYVISLKQGSRLFGFFSLTLVSGEFLELGDVYKKVRLLERDVFAQSIGAMIEWVRNKGYSGVWGYPNQAAVKLEMQAGLKLSALYKKRYSLVLLCFVIQIPVEKYDGALHLNTAISVSDMIRIRVNTSKTRLTKFGIPVLKLSIEKRAAFGILYEYIESRDIGDPFLSIIFNNSKSIRIGFENCDNSA